MMFPTINGVANVIIVFDIVTTALQKFQSKFILFFVLFHHNIYIYHSNIKKIYLNK